MPLQLGRDSVVRRLRGDSLLNRKYDLDISVKKQLVVCTKGQ